jgi:hypothetical protein
MRHARAAMKEKMEALIQAIYDKSNFPGSQDVLSNRHSPLGAKAVSPLRFASPKCRNENGAQGFALFFKERASL